MTNSLKCDKFFFTKHISEIFSSNMLDYEWMKKLSYIDVH